MGVYIERALDINHAQEQKRIEMNETLIESIYLQYYKNVYNYIGFRINNHFDAEELSSIVFEKVICKFHTYNKKLPIEAWLIGIAKNVVTDYLRKRKTFAPLSDILELVSLGRVYINDYADLK